MRATEEEIRDTIAELQARKGALDTQIAVEKALTGEVSRETAMAWWNVAVTIRDLGERIYHPALCH